MGGGSERVGESQISGLCHLRSADAVFWDKQEWEGNAGHNRRLLSAMWSLSLSLPNPHSEEFSSL